MGGYAVCLLRKLRLKAALEECVTKQEFRNLPKGQKPPDWMIKLIKDEHYWDRTYQMLRALYGPYRVLRLCDTQAAVMDKVYYFASKTLEDLTDKQDDFNKWKLSGNMKEAMLAITKKSKEDIEKRAQKYSGAATFSSDEDTSSEAEEVETDDGGADEDLGFGDQLLALWKKKVS
jgi:hypothetical protein